MVGCISSFVYLFCLLFLSVRHYTLLLNIMLIGLVSASSGDLIVCMHIRMCSQHDDDAVLAPCMYVCSLSSLWKIINKTSECPARRLSRMDSPQESAGVSDPFGYATTNTNTRAVAFQT